MIYLFYLFLFLLGLALAALLLFLGDRIMKRIHILYGPVFIPSKDRDLQIMFKLADLKPGQIAADLGSGNGKILIYLAQHGVEVHGFENSPSLVWQSRQKISDLGLQKLATVHWQDFWYADLSKYDVIMMYTSKFTMEQLEAKIRTQLKPGARVVSNTFKFPHWPIAKTVGGVYLYVKE
jgi:hypothetical protein